MEISDKYKHRCFCISKKKKDKDCPLHGKKKKAVKEVVKKPKSKHKKVMKKGDIPISILTSSMSGGVHKKKTKFKHVSPQSGGRRRRRRRGGAMPGEGGAMAPEGIEPALPDMEKATKPIVPGGEQNYTFSPRVPMSLESQELPIDKMVPFIADRTYDRVNGPSRDYAADSSTNNVVLIVVNTHNYFLRLKTSKIHMMLDCNTNLECDSVRTYHNEIDPTSSVLGNGAAIANQDGRLYPYCEAFLKPDWKLKIIEMIQVGFSDQEEIFSADTTKDNGSINEATYTTGQRCFNFSQHNFVGEFQEHLMDMNVLDDTGRWKIIHPPPKADSSWRIAGENSMNIRECCPFFDQDKNSKGVKHTIHLKDQQLQTGLLDLTDDQRRLRSVRLILPFKAIDSIFEGALLTANTEIHLKFTIAPTYKWLNFVPTAWTCGGVAGHDTQIYRHINGFVDGLNVMTKLGAMARDQAGQRLARNNVTTLSVMWKLPPNHHFEANRQQCYIIKDGFQLMNRPAIGILAQQTMVGLPLCGIKWVKHTVPIPNNTLNFMHDVYRLQNTSDIMIFCLEMSPGVRTKNGVYQNPHQYNGANAVGGHRTQYSQQSGIVDTLPCQKKYDTVKEITVNSYYKEENVTKHTHINGATSTRRVYNDQNNGNFVAGDDEDSFPQELLSHAAKNYKNLASYTFPVNYDGRQRDSTSGHWWVATLTPSRNIAPFTTFTQIRGTLNVQIQLMQEAFDNYPAWGHANDKQQRQLSFVAFTGRSQIVMQSGSGTKTFRLVSPSNPNDIYGRIHKQPGD